MSGALQAVFQNQRSFGPPPGQDAYTTAGTYSWVAPAGVTRVSVLAVGGGSGGGGGFTTGVFYGTGGGGGLGYKNNYTVVPASSYTVVVGDKSAANPFGTTTAGDSYFVSTAVVKGGGAKGANTASKKFR